MKKLFASGLVITLAVIHLAPPLAAEEWPMFGGTPGRNMVAPGASDLPVQIDPGSIVAATGEVDLATTTNCRWAVKLGSNTFATPTVAGGRVFIGTNNDSPRNPELGGDRGVLMVFDTASGEFLWQLAIPKIGSRILDWDQIGICSSPTIIGDRGYVVTNRCEVVCFDVAGMVNGNQGIDEEDVYLAGLYADYLDDPASVDRDGLYQPGMQDADLLWVYDMRRELGVHPHCASSSSILDADGKLFVTTGNGVDVSHVDLPSPDAPSLICLDPATGALLGQQSPIGSSDDHQIFHGSWSSPSYAQIGERSQVIFGGPDGWLYGLSSELPAGGGIPTLTELWRYDANPPEYRRDSEGNPIRYLRFNGPSQIVGTPVVYDGLIYTTIGQDPEHGEGLGMLSCIDPTGDGDLSGEAIWTFKELRRSISTVAAAGGLVYAADYTGFLYCLDAKTGAKQWEYDLFASQWSSPLVADGKLYIGDEDGELSIIDPGASLDEGAIQEVYFPAPIYGSPVAAGDTLFITTTRHLYAFANPAAPLDVLAVTTEPNSGDLRVTFGSSAGKTYEVYRSSDLANWELLDPAFPASNSDRSTFVDPGVASGGRYYYRFSENP